MTSSNTTSSSAAFKPMEHCTMVANGNHDDDDDELLYDDDDSSSTGGYGGTHGHSGTLGTGSDPDIDAASSPAGVLRARRHKKRRQRRQTIRRVLCGVALLLVSVACIWTIVALTVAYAKDGKNNAGGQEAAKDDGMAAGPAVQVTCGIVMGEMEDKEGSSIAVFKGVPYAAAPVGRAGRWLPPRPLDEETCWEGPYAANEYGTPCCQEGHVEEECEDCLFLNIWSPNLDQSGGSTESGGLPVMVHIHGGGLVVGSGNTPESRPTPELVLSSYMVHVSFNYRLGVLGFLALEELAELPREEGEDARHAAGNYGLMDQLMALKWVKQNIAKFGGNPDQVTVYGEDSGATSILALLAVKETIGLFHRAWMIGPSPHFNASLQQAQEQHKRTFLKQAKALSCERDVSGRELVDCLLAMSPMDIVNATNITAWHNKHFWSLPTPEEHATAIAIVDQHLLKLPPHEHWGRGDINPVPILIGNTAEEVSNWPQPPHVEQWNVTAYRRYVTERLAPWPDLLAEDPVSYYPVSPRISSSSSDSSSSFPSPASALASMITDMRTICGMDAKISVAAKYSPAPVYRYIVQALDDKAQSPKRRRAGFRGLDAHAFFDSFDEVDMVKTRKVLEFQRQIREMVQEFVRTGKLEQWQKFPQYTRLFNNGVNSSTPAYHSAQCLLWRNYGMFPKYAWIN